MEARVEQGIVELDKIAAAQPRRERKRKYSTAEAVIGGLGMLAKSLTAPVKIEGSAESQVADVKSTKIAEFHRSERMMDVESTLLSIIKDAKDDGKLGLFSLFSTRLHTVRVRIYKALPEKN